jgi:hypothetical protein
MLRAHKKVQLFAWWRLEINEKSISDISQKNPLSIMAKITISTLLKSEY